MVERNIIIGRAGGTAGRNSVNYKVCLPAEMVRVLGITPEERDVVLYMDGDRIIIEKKRR